MKHKRFPVEQTVAVLKQAELGMPVAALIGQVGMSKQTFYRWKKEYAGMQSEQARELKQLRDENARPKTLLAELSPDTAILQDVASQSVDKGSGLTGRLLDRWAYYHEVRLDFSQPGKPTDNSPIQTFSESLRDECLNVH